MATQATLENTEKKSFRQHLQEELLRRCRDNPGYSLRSFARALQINPASLSRMIRGERPISPEMKARLAIRLGLGPGELAEFATDSDPAGSGVTFHTLSLDRFAVISDWYHFAILELLNLRRFEPSYRWIAKTLHITASEARVAVERLVRVGLLRIDDEGRWLALHANNTSAGKDLYHAAYRRLQRQILEQAIRALDEVPLERRDQSSMTMAIDSSRLPAAIEKITVFRRELCSFLEQGEERDQIYQLAVALFPVTSLPARHA
jgi:plasmid maintenance system antidote protein VapI